MDAAGNGRARFWTRLDRGVSMALADVRDWVIIIVLPAWFVLKIISHLNRTRDPETEQILMARKIKQAVKEAVGEIIEGLNWGFIRNQFR